MKLNDAVPSVTHTVCVFGPPKCGKTELVGKLAEHFNLLWIDIENGWSTLTKMDEEWQKRIELVIIPDTRQFPAAIASCMKIFKGAPVTICEEHGIVGCSLCAKSKAPTISIHLNELGRDWIVVLDSGTQLSNSAIAHITKDKEVDYKMQTDDWGNLGKYLDFVLSHIQQAKYNCVVITHEGEVEMEDGKNKLVPFFGTRNFARNAAKYFGHVVHAEVKNRKHIAASATTYSTVFLTGSRTDVVMEAGAGPDLLRIFKPELFPNLPVVEDKSKETQGHTSQNKLAELRAKMAAKATGS